MRCARLGDATLVIVLFIQSRLVALSVRGRLHFGRRELRVHCAADLLDRQAVECCVRRVIESLPNPSTEQVAQLRDVIMLMYARQRRTW